MKTYDIDEAAVLLQASPSKIQELAQAGELPGARIGRSWVFLESVLEAWLAQEIERQVAERRRPTPRTKVTHRGAAPPDLSRYDNLLTKHN